MDLFADVVAVSKLSSKLPKIIIDIVDSCPILSKMNLSDSVKTVSKLSLELP